MYKAIILFAILLLAACAQKELVDPQAYNPNSTVTGTPDKAQSPAEEGTCSERFDACPEFYSKVCGWNNENIQCITYPCAQEYSNECFACQDENVARWTRGPCPAPTKSQTELSVEFRKDESVFDYGSDQEPDYVKLAKAHCNEREGEFNQCGSACRPGEFCTAVCVLTCDISAKKTKHIVKIENMRFSPKILTINKGDTVEFTNIDDVSHTATANGGYFSSPLLGKGQSWHFTFKDSGSYQYHSSPFRVAKGEIFVKD